MTQENLLKSVSLVYCIMFLLRSAPQALTSIQFCVLTDVDFKPLILNFIYIPSDRYLSKAIYNKA